MTTVATKINAHTGGVEKVMAYMVPCQGCPYAHEFTTYNYNVTLLVSLGLDGTLVALSRMPPVN